MSNQCEQLHPMILEHANGSLASKLRSQIENHLADCADCRAFARDMATISQAVGSLPRKQTSPDFDTRLAMRLAEAQRISDAKPAWRLAIENFFSPHRSALRPGLALCSVAAALGFAVFLAPQPAKNIAPPHVAIDENAMLTQCIEQHRTETAAQPLDDWSAQNLSQQLDKAPAAAPSAESLAEESNL